MVGNRNLDIRVTDSGSQADPIEKQQQQTNKQMNNQLIQPKNKKEIARVQDSVYSSTRYHF